MRTLAITLGIKPFVPYCGVTRLIKSPEMVAKAVVRKPQTSDHKSGKHKVEKGLSTRQRVVEMLSDGNRYTLREVSKSLDLSPTTTARHLIDLTDTGAAMTTATIARGSWINPSTYWIEK